MTLFDDIPDDPELAFLHLEKLFRDDYERALGNLEYDQTSTEQCLLYLSRTLAARTELGLKALENWRVPDVSDFSSNLYRNFLSDVEHYRTILEIRHSRRNKGLTVRFDAAAKSKLRHHLAQMREFIGKLELEDWKRDDLYKAINALELEIDRDRSRLAIFGDFVAKIGGILGESAGRAEPMRKWIDSISRLIWGAQMKERTESLAAPPQKRHLPSRPKQISPPEKRTITDQQHGKDEIPF